MRRQKEMRRSLFAFALAVLAQVAAPAYADLADMAVTSVRLAKAIAGTVDASPRQAAFTAEEIDAINDAIVASHPSVTILGDPTSRYDCHGFTFGAGSGWVQQDHVESILADQGWILRADGAQQVGDIAIYRKEGVITHSGVVSAVEDGTATRIRSKWGTAGLYEHNPTDVPKDYGQVEIRHRGTALATIPAEFFGPQSI